MATANTENYVVPSESFSMVPFASLATKIDHTIEHDLLLRLYFFNRLRLLLVGLHQ
jgi:hypothetical protein